jgi:hypothetical protein
MNYY